MKGPIAGVSSRLAAAVLVLALALATPVMAQDSRDEDAEPEATATTSPTRPGTRESAAHPPSTELTLAGPVDPNTYRLGPGDVVVIQMWGRVSRSSTAEVGPEGVLILPGSGSMQVAGRTLTEVRQDVLAKMRSSFRDVSIDVRLSRPRAFLIYLTGQVLSPGPTRATGASRVGDLLTPAVLSPNGSRRRIIVNHLDGTRELADLDLFLLTGNASMNPWLRDGDVLNVPVATEYIFASGAVARAGRFELGAQDSLLTLFKLAGDPTPAADEQRALLVRWKDAFTADSLWFTLTDAYERRVNPVLREGDRLYVYFVPQYHLQHEATIQGEVARPGVYPITQGQHRLSDLMAAAGGFLGTADLTSVRVFHTMVNAAETDAEFDRLVRLSRSEMTDTEYEILRSKMAARRGDFRVNWFRLRQTPELDILLLGGDVVRVDPLVTSVRVEGEVRRPGIVEFDANRSINQYIELSGGFSERASKGKVRVTRSVTGQSLPSRDVPVISPGDLIWVPERSDTSIWQHLAVLIAVTAQVALIYDVVRN